MNAAGTGVHGDVVGKHETAGLGQEGVRRQHILEELAGVRLHDAVLLKAADAHDLLDERLRYDVHFIAACGLDDGVALARMQGDGEVAGQRPDGGRPDEEVELTEVEVRQLSEIVVHRELDVHGGAGVVLILDLRLGKRRLVVGAPVDGL